MKRLLGLVGLSASLFAPAPASAEPRLPVAEELSGTITVGDTTNSRGAIEDAFVVDLTAGQSLKVELRSSEFDAFLSATGPDGATVAEDDDSLGGSNARINFTAVTAGRYRIAVSSFQRGQSGDYTLRADVWVRKPLVVAKLELPARAQGALTDGDARRADGQWVKAFRFNAKAADEIEARLTAQFDAYLILLSPTGETVAQADEGGGGTNAKLRASLPLSGEYTLLVSSAASGSGGDFTVELLGAEPASATPARPLTPGTMQRANMAAQVGGTRVSDRYTLVSKGAQYLDARMSAENFDPLLSLVGPGGDLLATDDDSGGGTNARIRYTLPAAGNYTLIASRFDAATGGDYLLSAELTQPPTVAALPLRLGTQLRGAFTTGDVRPIQGTGFADLYRFEGRAGQMVTVAVTSHAMPALRVTTPSGEQLPVPAVSATGESTFTLPQTGGYLFALVSESAEDATYQLKVVEADAKALAATRATLTVGTTFDGDFKPSDRDRPDGQGKVDGFDLEIPTAGLYELKLEADELDPVLELQRADGEALETNDDYGGGTNARILRPLAAGRYRVNAMSLGGQTGRYRLRAEGYAEVPFEMNAVQMGAVVLGDLSNDDPLLQEISRRADIYRLPLKAGQAVTITLRSTDVDSLLRVVDELGTTIAQNDDFGEQVDARVSFVQPFDGEVRIYCTSIASEGGEEGSPAPAGGGTGAYRLEVAPGLTRPSETSL
ncbi:MAG: pre-peptidase C-terminal domain-containing protein [Deltaproteobacteria bacterium]|nr:pre-peptidase C-terminal domain-containing protein [Deltaproteobacteria bacterium]